jgi:hypothetical protein
MPQNRGTGKSNEKGGREWVKAVCHTGGVKQKAPQSDKVPVFGGELVSIQKWPFSAISASICGIPCAAYYPYASAESLDFLALTKKFSFLIWKPLVCIF